jgi:hypothetical protein
MNNELAANKIKKLMQLKATHYRAMGFGSYSESYARLDMETLVKKLKGQAKHMVQLLDEEIADAEKVTV